MPNMPFVLGFVIPKKNEYQLAFENCPHQNCKTIASDKIVCATQLELSLTYQYNTNFSNSKCSILDTHAHIIEYIYIYLKLKSRIDLLSNGII
jgi:hypothetical protein